MNYRIEISPNTQEEVLGLDNEDGSTTWIPMVEENPMYQVYLNKDKIQKE
jgi:hypothetical protein